MRNLKRALSVALAAVMLLGMMVVGVGAVSINDFADKDEIVNQDAVALMVDLGVLEGLSGPNGTTIFEPNATLQRSAMAKIAYMVSTGATDWDLYASSNPKLTDVKGNWAQGAIEYCNLMGYITGYTDTVFGPNDTLTVAATATILLRVLGYDNAAQGYNGDQWMISAMRDAKANGLLNGVSNTNAASGISRQDACQMAYNALFAPTVTGVPQYDNGNKYIVSYTKGETLGYSTYSLVKVNATVAGVNNGIAVLDDVQPTVSGVTVALSATPNMIGSNVVYFVKSASLTKDTNGDITAVTASKLYSTALAEGASTTVFTVNGPYKGKTTNDDIIAQLATDKVATLDDTVTYYYNGAADEDGTLSKAEIGKKGVIATLKDNNGDGKVETIVVTKKSVGVLTADPTVNSKGVTIAALGVANRPAAQVNGYEGLVKGDVVLYVDLGGIVYIEKAEKITGTVSGNNTAKGALIGGKYYLPSEIGGVTYVKGSINDTKMRNFYLDDAGYVAYVELADQGETATASLAVIADVAWVKPVTDGALTTTTGKPYMQAKLVYTDGTTEIVTVASLLGATPVDVANEDLKDSSGNKLTLTAGEPVDSYKNTAAEGEAASWEVDKKVVGIGNNTATKTALCGKFYSYTKNSKTGAVTLTAAEGAADPESLTITSGKPAFATGLVGNANTVFVFATPDMTGKYSYATYTGIANVPSTKEAAKVSAVVTNGLATYVYVDMAGTTTATTSTDLVYIMSADCTQVTGTTNYIYDVLLNGEPKTLVLSATDYEAGAIYAVDNISDDVYTLGETALNTDVVAGIKSRDGGVLMVGADGVYTYTTGAPAFVVENGAVTATTIDALTLDGNDVIYVVANNGEALAAYVTVVSQAPTTDMTEAEVTVADGKATVTVEAAEGTTITAVSIAGVVAEAGEDNAWTTTENVTIPEGAETVRVVVTVTDNNSKGVTLFDYNVTIGA